MIRLGLTGGYGTGKSTVTRMFSELGAPVLNADDIVHTLLSHDRELIESITEVLGQDIVDSEGAIDRKKVADLVFDDKTSLVSLTNILYPVVRQHISRWFEKCDDEGEYRAAVAEVSMLIEGGALEFYDRIIVVIADPEVQRMRCLANRTSADDFDRRVRHQMPLDEKVCFADYVIDNGGTLEDTRKQVLEVWRKLT